MLKRIALYYFRLNRVRSFGVTIQGFMVAYLFLDKVELSPYWLLLTIPFGYVIHIFDKHYLLPTEQDIFIERMRNAPE